VDKYRKYCMWRGSDINAKKPPLAAWSLATRPKYEGGHGILNTATHNDALLLKNLHKFFNRADCPWVKLIWDNYYSSGNLLDSRPKGSFWWRGVLRQLDKFKGIAMVHLNNGSSVLLWQDLWNGSVRFLQFSELFSYTTRSAITVKQILELATISDIFQLPLSEVAFQRYLQLNQEIEQMIITDERDIWTYIWGNGIFSVNKAYKALTGHSQTYPVFNWLWSSKCQPKHKVFFRFLLHDKLNTRGRLRRRNMQLDSYTFENCILQKVESNYHLFLRCSFAKNCWASIGVTTPRISCPQ
jgi:hypothetical protein